MVSTGNPATDLALGAVSGAAAAILGDKVEDWFEGETHEMRVEQANAEALRLLHHIAHSCYELSHPIHRDSFINVIPGIQLSLNSDRAHVAFYTPQAINVTIQSAFGNQSLALGIGWTTLDRPEGSYLMLNTGSSTVIQLVRRDSDVVYGAEA